MQNQEVFYISPLASVMCHDCMLFCIIAQYNINQKQQQKSLQIGNVK